MFLNLRSYLPVYGFFVGWMVPQRGGQPAGDAGWNLWNNAHTATLEEYRNVRPRTDPQLYHPEAIKLMGGH